MVTNSTRLYFQHSSLKCSDVALKQPQEEAEYIWKCKNIMSYRDTQAMKMKLEQPSEWLYTTMHFYIYNFVFLLICEN